MNILVPMAGLGSRFQKQGYKNPKPFIDVLGKPMIRVVVDGLKSLNAKFIFVTQRAHKSFLPHLFDDIPHEIVFADGLTEGAVASCLLAAHLIQDDSLLIANSDQYTEWDAQNFLEYVQQPLDGCICVFKSNTPHFSFAKIDNQGYVTEVAEKQPISNLATNFLYWKRGADYVHYAKELVAKNIRFNNEFYNSLVYNLAIKDGLKIKTFLLHIEGIGTPEELQAFLSNKVSDQAPNINGKFGVAN